MITPGINLDDPQTRQFVGEYLDARRDGLLKDWTPGEYVRQRQRDEERKLIGGLSAGDDDDDFGDSEQ